MPRMLLLLERYLNLLLCCCCGWCSKNTKIRCYSQQHSRHITSPYTNLDQWERVQCCVCCDHVDVT